MGNWRQCQVSGSHQVWSLWVRQKQRPLGSSILLEESCCNSEPPVGIVLAGRLRQSLLPTLILHGDSGNLPVALCRAYLRQVGGGPTEELWWPRFQADLRHCDRLNNNIFCMFLYSWMCVLQSRHRSVCQFLKDMILKWNYSTNKSFLLLLKFIWVISGKGKSLLLSVWQTFWAEELLITQELYFQVSH